MVTTHDSNIRRYGAAGGGAAGAVATGAWVPLYQDSSDSLGIAINLLAADAGPDWGLLGVQRQVNDVGASINWLVGTGGLRITLPVSLCAALSGGAAGASSTKGAPRRAFPSTRRTAGSS